MQTFRSAYERLRFAKASLLFFTLLNLLVFSPALLQSGSRVLSKPSEDIATMIIPFRDFGFREMANGNIPLWNPHIFCGTPFMGGFQSALFYPPNWLHLVLPMGWALNIVFVMHFIMAGWFTALLVRFRGMHPAACLLAGAIYAYSGGLVLHMYGGHVMIVSAMAWMPLLVLAIDQVLEGQGLWAVLRGGLAVAMMVLAGHPQSVYYTALAIGLYFALRLILSPGRLRAVALVGAMAVIGAGISAVQLWHGMEVVTESSRADGVSIEFASMSNLPPENVITFIVPHFFGGIGDVPYYGREGLWTSSLFGGVIGLLLAIYGAFVGKPRHRRYSAVLVFLLLIFAMGNYTPLFPIMFEYVPGYTSNRDTGRFNLLLFLFLAILAASGLHVLLENFRPRRIFAGFVLGIGVILLVLSIAILVSAPSDEPSQWKDFLSWYVDTPIEKIPADLVKKTGHVAGMQTLLAAATALIAGVLLLPLMWRPQSLLILTGVGILEMCLFCFAESTTTELAMPYAKDWRDLVTLKDPHWRKCHATHLYGNIGMIYGSRDVYGYDPILLKRYSNLLAFSQGEDYTKQFYVPTIVRVSPVFRLMGVKVLNFLGPGGEAKFAVLEDPLPRLMLVSQVQQVTDRRQQLEMLCHPAFDASKVVLLESTPNPAPGPGAVQGQVAIVREGTDELEIIAENDRPAILLLADSYSKHWRIRNLGGTAQSDYQVMPADLAFRGVPLAAGKHHFVMEYAPLGYRAGRWVSLATLAAVLGLLVFAVARRKRASRVPTASGADKVTPENGR